MEDGEDGLCRSSSAIQSQLGPLSLLEERSVTPIVLLFSSCCQLPPKTGGNDQGIQINTQQIAQQVMEALLNDSCNQLSTEKVLNTHHRGGGGGGGFINVNYRCGHSKGNSTLTTKL